MADGNMRFIRKNGRIIPIREKDPSKAQKAANYKKHGDGANQAAKIDAKYEEKASKGTAKFALAGMASIGLGAAAFKKSKLAAVGLGLAGLGSSAAGHIKRSSNEKKNEVPREREYVKTFGTASDGQRPFKFGKKKRG